MASPAFPTLESMPAAAGHSKVEVRPFGIATTNDPRGI
jgi:hypothetical protein